MVPDEIRRKRDELAVVACKVCWCDDQGLDGENMPGVAPPTGTVDRRVSAVRG